MITTTCAIVLMVGCTDGSGKESGDATEDVPATSATTGAPPTSPAAEEELGAVLLAAPSRGARELTDDEERPDGPFDLQSYLTGSHEEDRDEDGASLSSNGFQRGFLRVWLDESHMVFSSALVFEFSQPAGAATVQKAFDARLTRTKTVEWGMFRDLARPGGSGSHRRQVRGRH